MVLRLHQHNIGYTADGDEHPTEELQLLWVGLQAVISLLYMMYMLATLDHHSTIYYLVHYCLVGGQL